MGQRRNQRGNKKYLETNKYGKRTHHTLQDAAAEPQREVLTLISTQEKQSQINSTNLHLQSKEKRAS